VTLDGTAGEPYKSPSQAQDGTIEAERGGKLYRMTQNGTLLNAPFATSAPVGFGLEDPLISPDGSKVSFWFKALECAGCVGEVFKYYVSYSDHFVPPETFGTGRTHFAGWDTLRHPTWLGNSRELIFSNTAEVEYYDLNAPNSEKWFNWQDVHPGTTAGYWEEGAASADGTRLAVLTQYEAEKNYAIEIYSAAGDVASANPPTKPTFRCKIAPPDGSPGSKAVGPGSLFDSLSWSPDGSSLAYEYNGAIYVASKNLETCEGPEKQVIPAGSDPNWGPANVNPAPRPSGNPGPAPKTAPVPTPAPVIANVAQTHRVWREGGKLAQISRAKKKPPVGTTFSFSLNVPGNVTFTFARSVAGRKVGHGCVARTRNNARRRSCKRTATAGSLSFPGHSGVNRVAFQGRPSQGRKLAPGGYTLTITASNSAGQTSSPQKLSFTIGK
jgi:hypothetical protein